MSRKKKIFLIISLFYILYTVTPIVPDVIGINVSLVNLFTFIVLFLLYPRAYLNPVIFWFIFYATILAFYVMFGKPLTIGIGTVHDSKKIIIEYAFLLPTLSIFSILYYLKDYRLLKIISYGGVFFIALSFLYITPMLFRQSTLLRDAMNLETSQNLNTIGVPGYTLMHAYMIAMPALLYGLKTHKNWRKGLLLSLIIMFVYIIINTYITTSIVITFAVIIIALLFDIQNKGKSFLLMLFVFTIVFVLHMGGVFIQMFDLLIKYFDGTAVQPKIESFKYIYIYGDIGSSGGSVTSRINLHNMSLKAFSENFLLGGTSPVGEHSSLLDRLGGMGLLAFTPFIMMIILQIKMSLKLLKNSEQKVYYYLGLTSAFLLLYQKGIFGQEGWLFLMILLPGLLISFKGLSKN